MTIRDNETKTFLSMIFEVDGERWKVLRQKLTTTFSSGKIKGMMPMLLNISDQFTDVISESADKKQCLNYREYCSRYMCEIIGQVAFGLECNWNSTRDSRLNISRENNLLF